MKVLIPLLSSLVALQACQQPILTVSQEEYTSTRVCWFKENGDFSAFVILNRDLEGYRPTFLSKTCQVESATQGAGYLFAIPIFPFAGDSGQFLATRQLDATILNNMRSHIKLFSDEMRYYEIEAKFKYDASQGGYVVEEPISLKARPDLDPSSLPGWK